MLVPRMFESITDSNWKIHNWEAEKSEIPHSSGELTDHFRADSWWSDWSIATDWRKDTSEICWTCLVSAFFVCRSGWSLQTLSFLECAAQSRASCPSSVALLWAQILLMSAALWQGEEAAQPFKSTTSRGEDHTIWEMLMTERGGPPSFSIRPADVTVSHD